MVRRSLDLSPRVQKVYAFIRQSASPHGPIPLANVALTAWGDHVSAGHEPASRAQSSAMCSRAYQGGKT
jgi:hypothetical protein